MEEKVRGKYAFSPHFHGAHSEHQPRLWLLACYAKQVLMPLEFSAVTDSRFKKLPMGLVTQHRQKVTAGGFRGTVLWEGSTRFGST